MEPDRIPLDAGTTRPAMGGEIASDELVAQIDALLTMNRTGQVSHRIPGLALELLERSRAALLARLDAAEPRVRVTRDALEEAYALGFGASAEGYNGEYPFEGIDFRQDAAWRKMRDTAISAIEGGPHDPA